MSIVRTIVQFLVTFLQGPGGVVVREAVKGAIASIGTAAFAVLMEEAKRYVGALEHVGVNDELKQAQVKSHLRDVAMREGINLSQSMLNFIVEAALQAVKAAA